jgi:hypothetical protein
MVGGTYNELKYAVLILFFFWWFLFFELIQIQQNKNSIYSIYDGSFWEKSIKATILHLWINFILILKTLIDEEKGIENFHKDIKKLLSDTPNYNKGQASKWIKNFPNNNFDHDMKRQILC